MHKIYPHQLFYITVAIHYCYSNRVTLHGYCSFVFNILIFFSLLVVPSHFHFLSFSISESLTKTLSLYLKVAWSYISLPLTTTRRSLLPPCKALFDLTLTLTRPKPKQPMPLTTATSVEVFFLFFGCLICGFGDLDLAWLLKI